MATITISKRKISKKIKLNRYAGKWVAFVEGKIVAYNKNLSDLMKEIDLMGLRKKASIFLVPRKDEGPYVLIILRKKNFLILNKIINLFQLSKLSLDMVKLGLVNHLTEGK
ncbi:MAG: DUF5678 domain-containing protein [Patescibacteria group bacterium]|nr:DUF5678 domain-containing protein [Patescibacteria group bacterium]